MPDEHQPDPDEQPKTEAEAEADADADADEEPMHIHRPKPLHGLRELAVEIGVIVIGVLIAIAAEQLVEGLGWRHKIHESEQAMRAELVADDGGQAFMRAAIAPCLDRQLQAIGQAVAARKDRAEVARLAHAYSPPTYTWDDQAWQSSVAAGIGPHMGARRTAEWSGVYSGVAILNHLTEQEFSAVSALRALPSSEGPLDDEDARRLTEAAATLERLNVSLYSWSAGFLKNLERLQSPVPLAQRTALIARARQRFGGCVVIPNPKLFRPMDNLTSEDERRARMYSGDTTVRP
ncbi:MAG TPA: hypothetical protein VGG29_13395 [Caulobacteraceae bacterium]|jgi:hypothetical protein